MSTGGSWFVLDGRYRVQGSLLPEPSRLEGRWLSPKRGLLTDMIMNAAIERNKRWQGHMHCTLRAAEICARSGQFENRADILYKKGNFEASQGTPGMPANIVDLSKALRLWERRRPVQVALIGVEGLEAALHVIGDLDRAIVNEYFLHEAGHCLGYSVDEKVRDHFFALGGEPSAVLIALEELRADVHGFQLGLEVLEPADAASSFMYYILQRFGVHVEGLHETNRAPYGLVPFLLFDVLQVAGIRLPHDTAAQWPAQDVLIAGIRDIATIIDDAVTGPEMSAGSPVTAALAGAQYVRQRLLDERRTSQYLRMVDGGLARLQAS